MTTRRTADRPLETIVWRQGDKLVIREHDSGQYRAQIHAAPVGWFRTAREAEDAVNEAMYELLSRKAAA